jgi:hypothetical protein
MTVSVYQRAIVTFLDILGFAKIVEDASPSVIDLMLDAIDTTAAAPGLIRHHTEEADVHVLSFSDSVIRIRPCSQHVSEGVLICELEDLAATQWLLTQEGILVRGGMTIGDISVAESRAFGPAFVRAYELESRFAHSPRIVLDPDLIRVLRTEKTLRGEQVTLRGTIKRVRDFVSQGDDGLWQIDYLTAVWRHTEDQSYHREGMTRHREMIIEKSKDLSTRHPYLPKYLWLARYHNLVARKVYRDDNSLRVGRTDFPIFDELLLPKIVLKRGRSK